MLRCCQNADYTLKNEHGPNHPCQSDASSQRLVCSTPLPHTVGLIGSDTSHVIAFTRSINESSHPAHASKARSPPSRERMLATLALIDLPSNSGTNSVSASSPRLRPFANKSMPSCSKERTDSPSQTSQTHHHKRQIALYRVRP